MIILLGEVWVGLGFQEKGRKGSISDAVSALLHDFGHPIYSIPTFFSS